MSGFHKQRNIIDFTISSLLRRKGKNGALLAVYTLVVFLFASVMFCATALRREAAIVLATAPELVVQRSVAGRHDLIPVSYGDRIRSIKGVRSVNPRLWGYYYDPLFGANYTLVVPEEFPSGNGTAVVGSGLVRSSMAAVGNIMPLRTHDGRLVSLTVTDILPETTELVAADLVLLTAEDYRMLFGLPGGMATDLVVTADDPAALAAIARQIDRLLPDTRQITRDTIHHTYDAIFNWRNGILLVVCGGALLALLIFALDKLTGLAAAERVEIGILKGIGWDTVDVLAMKLWEGVIISLLATLTGLILAYLHVFQGAVFLFAPLLRGWAVLAPQYRLVPVLDPAQLAIIGALAVVPYTMATVLPAWRAAAGDPATIMQQ